MIMINSGSIGLNNDNSLNENANHIFILASDMKK